MNTYFILDERGEPRHEKDFDSWSRWFEQADRAVARSIVTPEVAVLTTFEGVSEADTPALFQTRVFGGVLDGEEALHANRLEAMSGHATLVQWCRVGNARDSGVREEHLT